jgi:hypothetical protein
MRNTAGVLATIVCGAMAATAVSTGTAVAGPVPRPPSARQAAAPRPAGHHGATRHHPRTVMRCQSDDTDQIEEFGDDDEPRDSFTPAEASGRCSGDALGIARILAGDHPRRRPARPVR